MNALTKVRRERLMTRAELADKAGVSYDTIYKIEKGTEPTEPMAIKLARALNCSLREVGFDPRKAAA